MPRKKTTGKTLLEAAVERASAKLKTANDKAAQSKKPEDIEAASKAKAELDKATIEANRERFVNFAETRTSAIIKSFRALSGTPKPATYKYEGTDVDRIFSAIRLECDAAEKRLRDLLTSPNLPASSLFKL